MAKRFKGMKPRSQIGDEAHLWSGEQINVEEWALRGSPEMWKEVDSSSFIHKNGAEMIRLDLDEAYGSLRLVSMGGKVMALGKDVVFYETESFSVVGIGSYYLLNPTLFCRVKEA